MVPGASKGIPGDAKCVTEMLGDKNKEVGGQSLPFTFLFQEKISAFNRLQKSLGGGKNKDVGGNSVLLGHYTVPLPFQ